MKAMTKVALVTASILSMGALTACQSTSSKPDHEHGRMMQDGKHKHRMSPEQREQMQQMRAQHQEFRDQAQKACDGKSVGQTVQIKTGDKTVDGTCNLVFKADQKTRDEMRQEFQRLGAENGRMHRGGMRMHDMTEEQRIEVQKQFEQKRTERQAQWNTIQKSCEGQTNGKTVQVKVGEKTLGGTCVVKFQPQQPIPQAVVPTASAPATKTS